MQKKYSKNDIITKYRSSDQLLCPVKIWSGIIRRIIGYSSTTPNTTVHYYLHPDSIIHKFLGKDLLGRIRIATTSLRHNELSFSPEELDLCSARSGVAMAMYLAGVAVFTIILLGRWSSDTFLHYICKQV
jgi:hypothetical protein